MKGIAFIIIGFLAGAWLVAMSAVAIREALHRPGDNYREFVKYFAGASIVVGVAIIAGMGYVTYNRAMFLAT